MTYVDITTDKRKACLIDSRDTSSDKQSGKSKLSPDGMKVVKFIHETVLNTANAPTVGEIQATWCDVDDSPGYRWQDRKIARASEVQLQKT